MSTIRRIRLDQLLVERGLAESREKAQRIIRAGQARVGGHPQTKPGHLFPADCEAKNSKPQFAPFRSM
jgi:23S rRNA (cytidine1920-2'-O)/16S rRNA (cytidine1409-2'-O)-methyltransferase